MGVFIGQQSYDSTHHCLCGGSDEALNVTQEVDHMCSLAYNSSAERRSSNILADTLFSLHFRWKQWHLPKKYGSKPHNMWEIRKHSPFIHFTLNTTIVVVDVFDQ